MQPLPSTIPVGNEYMATIRIGSDETILEDCGRRLRFASSAAALKAARLEIASRTTKAEASIQIPAEPESVREWKEKRLKELEQLRSAATLMGVQVVRKKRRAVGR